MSYDIYLAVVLLVIRYIGKVYWKGYHRNDSK